MYHAIRAVCSAPLLFALRKYNISRFYSRNFKTLASFCGCAGRFVSWLVVGDSRRHFFSWGGSVYNRSRLSADVTAQLNYFWCTCKLCTLMPSTMVDLTNQGRKEISVWFIPFNRQKLYFSYLGNCPPSKYVVQLKTMKGKSIYLAYQRYWFSSMCHR